MKRFSVKETFHDYRLVDNITGLEAPMGDGVGESSDPLGTEEFRVAWEDEANESGEYFEAYFPRLDSLVIYDNDGETIDRYTVLVEPASSLERSLHAGKDLWVCLGLSSNCDSPQGYALWGHAVPNERLGEKVHFLQLPDNVQRHIAERLEEYAHSEKEE